MRDTSSTSHEPDADRRFLAGVIVLCFAMNAIGRGLTETFAVFLLPVEAALGVDRGSIAATYAVYMLGYALAAPFAGQLIDRLGPKVCYGVGLGAIGMGYLAAGSVQSIGAYYVAVGVLGGIGAAALGMVAASSLIARWFTRQIGFTAALPYAAMGAGMILFPPLAQVLIDAVGWRDAYRLLGAVALAALAVVLILPLRRVGAGSAEWRARRVASTASGATSWTVTAAVQTGAFWALFLAYFMTSVAAYAVLPHSVAYLVERGISPLAAASAFGLTGLMSAIGIIAMGWASDRFGRLPAVTVSYLVTMAGIASLLVVTLSPSLVWAYGFVILFGLMQGARGPILVALVARIFAGGSVGTIFGALSAALGLGAGVGSLASGLLHEATGSYVAGFLIAIAACGIGMATFWLSPAIRRERVGG
jgi:MFS family permease